MSDSGEKPKIITGDDWKQRPEQDAASQKPEQGGAADKKLHVDDDWKAQARAEKERLAKEAAESAAGAGEGGEGEEAAGGGGGGGREMPPANFQTLLSTIASQALLYMGAIPDPSTGQRIAHLELAKHHIDLLAVLEEKTKGNLDDEEAQMVGQTVRELRMYYTQVADQLARQQAQQGGQGPQGPGGGMGGANPFGGQGGPGGPGGPIG